MKGDPKVIDALNDLLTLELTVVNQYFVHSKMCANWGYKRLADRFRQDAMDEMKDAEEIIDRILYYEGVPNVQRIGTVALGETPQEQLQLGLDAERGAVDLLTQSLKVADKAGDEGTREFLAPKIAEEEAHIDWFESQLQLIEQVGLENYLAAQIRE
ncbi:MAG: bacterioferritin [Actinomycetota bacterium]